MYRTTVFISNGHHRFLVAVSKLSTCNVDSLFRYQTFNFFGAILFRLSLSLWHECCTSCSSISGTAVQCGWDCATQPFTRYMYTVYDTKVNRRSRGTSARHIYLGSLVAMVLIPSTRVFDLSLYRPRWVAFSRGKDRRQTNSSEGVLAVTRLRYRAFIIFVVPSLSYKHMYG